MNLVEFSPCFIVPISVAVSSVHLHFFPSFHFCWPRHTSQVLLPKTASLDFYAFFKTFAFSCLLFFEDVENKTSEVAKQEKSLDLLFCTYTLIDLPPRLLVSTLVSFENRTQSFSKKILLFFYLVVYFNTSRFYTRRR